MVSILALSGLTEDARTIQELAFSFAAKELAPNMKEWDEKVYLMSL